MGRRGNHPDGRADAVIRLIDYQALREAHRDRNRSRLASLLQKVRTLRSVKREDNHRSSFIRGR